MPKAPGASPPQPLFREQRLGASDSLDGLYLPGIPASLPVTVVPPVLHFGSECPLCIPSIGTAELINLSEDEDLEVHSISSQSEHFHAPLSELQRLPPGGRMNISIVFLPRAKGSVNTTLLIQTSAGGFFYPVHGGGGPNPYSVHPLLPSAVLHGSAYEPLISIRNPHGTPMQIKEVLSSEPFVHLMLPPAEIQHGAVTLRELWTVAPGETKAVLALRIDSTDATALSNATALTSGAEGGPIEVGVYRAYVHVKTDFDTLIIPVQVPVLREGVFAVMPGGSSPIGELNFGTLTNPDSVVTLPISLLSNIDAPRLKVLDVRALRHHSSMHVQLSRKIEGTSPMLNPLEEREIVLVSFSGKVPGNFSGKLRVRFEHPDPRWADLIVPWSARVLHGSLAWRVVFLADPSTGAGSNSSNASVAITNHFKVPVLMQRAYVNDPLVTLTHFQPVIVPPGATVENVASFTQASTDTRVDQVFIDVFSNATATFPMRIPIHVYHGRLGYDYAAYPRVFEGRALAAETNFLDLVQKQQTNQPEMAALAARMAAGTLSEQEATSAALASVNSGQTNLQNVPIVPLSPLRPNGEVIHLEVLARGARKRVLLNMSNPNPISLHVHSIQYEERVRREPHTPVSGLPDECLGACELLTAAKEVTSAKEVTNAEMLTSGAISDDSLEMNRVRAARAPLLTSSPSLDESQCCVPVKLEWTLISMKNEIFLPIILSGSKKLWETSVVDGYEPRGPWDPSRAQRSLPLLVIPPKARMVIAVDVIAQAAGLVDGTLVMHLDMMPPMGRPSIEQRFGLVGEAVEGDLVFVKSWGHQNETTHIEGTPGHVSENGLMVKPFKRRRYGVDAHTCLDFRSSAPGTTRELPVILYSAFHEPQFILKLSASLWWKQRAMKDVPLPSLSVIAASTVSESVIKPRTRTVVGWARLSTETLLPRDEYDQLVDEPFFHATPGAPLDKAMLQTLRRRQQRWEALAGSHAASELRGEVRMDTSLVQNVTIPVRISFAWPSVAENVTVPFGFVQQGLTGEVRVFTRRTHWNYWLQVLTPESDPLLNERARSAPLPKEAPVDWNLVDSAFEPSAFTAHLEVGPKASEEREVGGGTKLLLDPSSGKWRHLQQPFQVRSSEDETVVVAIQFTPTRLGSFHSWFYLRNNYSLLDEIFVYGTATSGALEFSQPVLHFEAAASDLPCESDMAKYAARQARQESSGDATNRWSDTPRKLTRKFTMVNNGEVPIVTTGASLNGHACGHRGIRILGDCARNVTIPARGGTAAIKLRWTPDFEVSRLMMTLAVDTSVGSSSVPVVATIPTALLLPCMAERRAKMGASEAEQTKRGHTATVLIILFGIMVQFVVTEALRSPSEQPTTAAPKAAAATAAAAAASPVRPATKAVVTSVPLASLSPAQLEAARREVISLNRKSLKSARDGMGWDGMAALLSQVAKKSSPAEPEAAEPVADEGREGHSVFAWHLMRALEGLDQWQPGSNLFERVRAGVVKDFPQTPQYGASRAAGHQGETDYVFERRELDATP